MIFRKILTNKGLFEYSVDLNIQQLLDKKNIQQLQFTDDSMKQAPPQKANKKYLC